jgi:hypothetical protein
MVQNSQKIHTKQWNTRKSCTIINGKRVEEEKRICYHIIKGNVLEMTLYWDASVNGEDAMKMKIIVMDEAEKRLGTFELEAGGVQEVEQALRCREYRSGVCSQHADPVKQVFIRTFGYFDIFVNSHPIEFSCSKAKELLALLVDRGGESLRRKR